MKHTLLPVIGSLFLCACHATLPAGERIGQPMEVREIHTLAVVDSTPEDYLEQTLLVEATVTAVCENAGCWMKVEDDGHDAMVRWESGCGGEYTFPKEALGKRVVIQGSYYPKTISEEDARHIESEAAEGVTIPRETYELNASAILVRES